MRLFAISDLHLSFTSNKPMDIFAGWENYQDRLYENWQKIVSANDTVVIAGDVSWGISLEESLADFKFLNSLNGKKIIIKGNHDYWWSTVSKIRTFFKENALDTLDVLHNSCYPIEESAICGTRGWVYDGTGEKDIKVINRECGRLERSIVAALELNKKPIVFLHYPPVYGDYVCKEIVEILKKYGIDSLYYGHIHGGSIYKTLPQYNGIVLKNLSADRVSFTPVLIQK
ncbi:MAG: metallophosphoesterase [Clostridia bacterium]|nr:metallophosphoesterase [Clostridia bacterium]